MPRVRMKTSESESVCAARMCTYTYMHVFSKTDFQIKRVFECAPARTKKSKSESVCAVRACMHVYEKKYSQRRSV